MAHSSDDRSSRRSFLRSTGLAAGTLALGGRVRPAIAAVAVGGKPTDIRIVSVRHDFESYKFRTPLKFGGSLMEHCILFNVTVRAKRADGKSAEGFGSMVLGNVWSWPPRYVAPDLSLNAMKQFGEVVVKIARDCDDRGHALDLARAMLPEQLKGAVLTGKKLGLAGPMPKLCALVVISSLDAALHDAFGKVNGVNSYNALGKDFVRHDLSKDLDSRFKGKYLDAYTLREPKGTMPLYHLVGALDPLTDADIKQRLNDGLPETLPEWIRRDGLTHLKIKLNGSELGWDVDRVLAIDRIATETQGRLGISKGLYSADFNERCPDVAYLLEFFAKIKEKSPQAFDRIQYIEQPTDRDLKAHPENKMHEAAKVKPVVIDESLTDYESLLLARDQGYSGVALKACKGITEALLMAAAALEFEMFLTVQDLTCTGASFLQSAELSARVPTVAAIEGNGRQYCPAANKGWEDKYPELFVVRNGTVKTQGLTKPGLGH